MTITLHCLDCGFRISVTLAPNTGADEVSLSCGQCRCRRWALG